MTRRTCSKPRPARWTAHLPVPIAILLLGISLGANAESDPANATQGSVEAEPDTASTPAGNPKDLEEVEVLGSWLPPGAYATGQQRAVTADDLAQQQPADAEQLLARVPGFSVSRPGGSGGVSEVFLRGAESNFTVVLVDGLRMNDSSNTRGGAYDFSTLASGEIDRIQVATGAMSAIHGADAMAGVIRIETLFPDPGETLAFGELSTEHGWRTGAGAGTKLGSSELALKFTAEDGGTAVPGASHELGTFSSRIRNQGSGYDWSLVLRATDRQRTAFPEVSGGPDLAVLPELEQGDAQTLGAVFELGLQSSSVWSWNGLLSWSSIEQVTATPPVPPGVLQGQPAFKSDSRYRRSHLRWVGRRPLGPRSDLAVGLALIDERGDDSGYVEFGGFPVPNAWELDRPTASVFAEWGYRWTNAWSANLAIRGDQTDSEDQTWRRASGIVGLERRETLGGRLWARAANGFKLPSFFALGNPLFGNPALKPETVVSLELGWSRDFGNHLSTDVSYFQSEFEDLVDFDFETFRNINRGTIDITGWEVSSVWTPTRSWTLTADATLSHQSSADGPLRRRPEDMGGMTLLWKSASNWTIDAAARYVGSRLVTSIPTGDVREQGYWVLNGTLRYGSPKGWSAWAAIDNALDESWQDAPGFPAPGRILRLGAEWRP